MCSARSIETFRHQISDATERTLSEQETSHSMWFGMCILSLGIAIPFWALMSWLNVRGRHQTLDAKKHLLDIAAKGRFAKDDQRAAELLGLELKQF